MSKRHLKTSGLSKAARLKKRRGSSVVPHPLASSVFYRESAGHSTVWQGAVAFISSTPGHSGAYGRMYLIMFNTQRNTSCYGIAVSKFGEPMPVQAPCSQVAGNEARAVRTFCGWSRNYVRRRPACPREALDGWTVRRPNDGRGAR